MSSPLKIAILGSKGTTLDLIRALSRQFSIAQVITLNPRTAERSGVAFYAASAIGDFCKQSNIPLYETKSYNLNAAEDLTYFAQAQIDVLCVIGWERLIPDAVLASLGKFACGMHGSAYGLPRGRGRSPLNWSIIQGKKRFTTYLFRYTAGVDDGDVIGSKTFEINDHDTIETLHHKNRVAMTQLLETYLPLIERDAVVFSPQAPGEPSFYPKRTPNDGGVDWRESTTDIHRLIRAVAPPYPGAFAFLDERAVRFLDAQPFDDALFATDVPSGTIVDISAASRSFVVKTRDGSLLVQAFDGVEMAEIFVGRRFTGVDRLASYRDIAERYATNVPRHQWEIDPERA